MYNFVFDKRKVNVQCNAERIKILVVKFSYQNYIRKTIYKRSTGHLRVMLDKLRAVDGQPAAGGKFCAFMGAAGEFFLQNL